MKTFNEFVDIAEKVSQSPKPTVLPISRERNIGKHDDWKDPHPDTRDFGVKPPAAQKLKSRLNAVVGTQRRQDKETGVTNEDTQQFFEDIESRRKELHQRQSDQMSAQKQRVADYHAAQKQKREKEQERAQLKQEIKRELQTEQTPTMEPNLYSQLVARRQVAQKTAHIKHVHSEIGAAARAQEAARQARLKAIMSR